MIPVSYTHLDVYKRQGALAGVGVAGGAGQGAGVVPLLLGGRLIGCRRQHVLRGVIARQDAGHRRPGQGVVDAPVSYTHLDVYKRQL